MPQEQILIALTIANKILYHILLSAGCILSAAMAGPLLIGLWEWITGKNPSEKVGCREFYVGAAFVAAIILLAWRWAN